MGKHSWANTASLFFFASRSKNSTMRFSFGGNFPTVGEPNPRFGNVDVLKIIVFVTAPGTKHLMTLKPESVRKM
jgi:hypothetical protein